MDNGNESFVVFTNACQFVEGLLIYINPTFPNESDGFEKFQFTYIGFCVLAGIVV